MKKKISVIFILFTFIFTLNTFFAFISVKANASYGFDGIQSRSAYLCDETGNHVIYAKNEDLKLPIASMCKIMTLLLSFEEIDAGNISLDEKIVVSQNASNMGGSQVFLEANEEYLISNLIKSIVVASANDASVAMAERIAGSEEAFVEKMNEKAKSLGMENTQFVNSTGLPKIGQHSTAKDVAKMYSELIKHKDYFKYSNIWMDEIKHKDGRVTEISNTNKLIRFYKGCEGGKTGYTSEAKHCLTASAVRGDLKLISVVISAPDSKTRFKDASSMFDYGFANFTSKKIIDDSKVLDVLVKVEKGKKDSIQTKPKESVSVFMEKNEKANFELAFKSNEKIYAPLNIGDEVGEITVYKNGVELKTVKVVSAEDVDKASFFDYVKKIGVSWSII